MKGLAIFETHAHYDDKSYDVDRDEVLREVFDKGVDRIINVSSDLRSMENTLELARNYDQIYAAIGIHPDEVYELNENNFQKVRELSLKDKVVAIGEIGLDYHRDDHNKDIQRHWFERQMQLASALGKPVIIHSRDACEDTLDVLREFAHQGVRGVMHCYSYSVETARELLKMGYYIGIGGVVTFKNSRKLIEVVDEVPLERILLETDCPYMAPTPYRGTRNYSGHLPLIAEKIAAIKDVQYQKVLEKTYKNAKDLFLSK